MDIKLPESAFVNKFIAKNKFYDKVKISTRLQNEFTQTIKRITWKYKLAESTVSISKTESITEIQIFEIELKEKKIPKNAIKVIDRTIPYQILYLFRYNNDEAYAIALKRNNVVDNYYFSEWNQELNFDFSGIDLEKVYQKLIKSFITTEAIKLRKFDDIISLDNKITTLERDIVTLENKIKKENQFNRKVELNKILLEKQQQLVNLKEVE